MGGVCVAAGLLAKSGAEVCHAALGVSLLPFGMCFDSLLLDWHLSRRAAVLTAA